MERPAPPSPLVGEPQPEETVEAPELRSLRSAAKQDELLPQRQVLEREVSAGSERRTQRAQESDYEGHCLPGSHAAGSSSSLGDRILAKDRSSNSRRIVPITRSAKGFCQGERGAVRTSAMPMPFTRRRNSAP